MSDELDYNDPNYGVYVSVSDYWPGQPVQVTLPSDIWMDIKAARAFAVALVQAADYAEAHPELYPADGPAP